jgi:outer membrane lipoprotein SlyB
MKRFITSLIMTAVLAMTIPALSTSASAQTRRYYNNTRTSRYYSPGTTTRYYTNGQPNVYDRHRKAINIAAATGVGAILGALFGGRKGAVIGAAAGAVGGVIVTKKQSPRNYYRY